MHDAGSAGESGEYSYGLAQGNGARASVYITFIEPIIVGPLGPWSLLKNGVELHAASPFAAFSPVVPYMNSMQISMQFNQDQLARNLFVLGRNINDTDSAGNASNVTCTLTKASVMCKFISPPQSHQIKSLNSYSIPTWEGIRYTKNVAGLMAAACVPASMQKTELSYVTLNSAPDMIYFACRPKASTIPSALSAFNTDEPTYRAAMERSKGVNMEIMGIDMSINTSSNVLNQTSQV